MPVGCYVSDVAIPGDRDTRVIQILEGVFPFFGTETTADPPATGPAMSSSVPPGLILAAASRATSRAATAWSPSAWRTRFALMSSRGS